MHEEKNIHKDENLEEEKLEKEKTEEDVQKKVQQHDEKQEEKQDVKKDEVTDEKLEEQDDEEPVKPEDEVARLTAKIQELEEKLQEKENRLLRLQADFDNYRKRTRNEMEAFKKYRSQELALELLNSLDNFERALATDAQTEEGKAILEGMEMVYKSILAAFEKEGITPIEAVGKEFDPNYHHAVMQDQNEEYSSNIITEELQKGYMIRDRVLRPSMVKVNQ